MNEEKYKWLLKRLSETDQSDYPCESRIHRLRSFPGCCFVKRDDELGFGISGSKIRKYRSLLPDLLRNGIQRALIIGGASSNNVLGLSQLLIEAGIRPILYLRGSSQVELHGNHLFLRMLVPPDDIHWVSLENWPSVDAVVEQEAESLRLEGIKSCVIPEGASLPASMPGAATLAVDLIRNRQVTGREFSRLFVDAGTGMIAAATALALSWMEVKLPVSITLIAGDADSFQAAFADYRRWFEDWLQNDVAMPSDYDLIVPERGKSFGSVNAGLVDRSIGIAGSEGIFTDLIYSTKHFESVRQVLNERRENGDVVIVHSGGGLSLSGYQGMLAKRMIEK